MKETWTVFGRLKIPLGPPSKKGEVLFPSSPLVKRLDMNSPNVGDKGDFKEPSDLHSSPRFAGNDMETNSVIPGLIGLPCTGCGGNPQIILPDCYSVKNVSQNEIFQQDESATPHASDYSNLRYLAVISTF